MRVRDAGFADLLEGTHLVYLALGRAVHETLGALGLTDDPLLALQLLDVLFGAAAVGVLWLLFRRAGGTRHGAFVASGGVAFSYAFWHNAVEAEVYAFSALALVCSLLAAWRAARSPTVTAFAVLGLANGVAVVAHVTNALFAGVAAAALALAARAVDRRKTVTRWAAAYASGVAALVVPAYAAAAVLNDLFSPSAFREWFLERTGEEGDYGSIGLANLTQAFVGGSRALIGGHFALTLDAVREFAADRFTGKTFTEELYFLEGYPSSVAAALLVISLVTVALLGWCAARWLRHPHLTPEMRSLAVLAAVWLALDAALFAWWDPLNIELWYAVWVPAAVLLAVPFAESSRASVATAAVAGLFLVNLAGSAVPQRDEQRDLWRAKATWYRDNVRPDDLVVSNGYVWSAYLRHLLGARVAVVDIEDLFREAEEEAALAGLNDRIEGARGRVLVSGEALRAFADRRAACLDAPRTCAIAAATARGLQGRCTLLAAVADPPERVWRCRPGRRSP